MLKRSSSPPGPGAPFMLDPELSVLSQFAESQSLLRKLAEREMADQQDPPEDPDRPSFTSFWKKAKEGFTAKRITFVPSNPGQSSATASERDEASSEATAKDKAQLRRAQVRRAQIQHRQRKANYVRQLEIDISGIRDQITAAEKGRQVLMSENQAIKDYLGAMSSLNSQAQLPIPASLPAASAGPSFSDDDLGEFNVSLRMDDIMQGPAYHVSGSASPDNAGDVPRSSHFPPVHDVGLPGLPEMTPEQTQAAINFILALERVCWPHFSFEDFTSTTDTAGVESGHSLMASSLALQTAPESVFASMEQTVTNLKENAPDPIPADMTWQSSGLTLQSLYGLACSLNLSDKDLTPVQAWFEMASLYPMSLLLRRDIIDTLKMEFMGVVKCPHYGAVIERSAFESVVGRVLEPAFEAFQAQEGERAVDEGEA